MTQVRFRPRFARGHSCWTAVGFVLWLVSVSHAQSSSRPTRLAPPVFQAGEFEGIFFEQATSRIRGELTSPTAAGKGAEPSNSAGPLRHANDPGRPRPSAADLSREVSTADASGKGASHPGLAWEPLIEAETLEDLIKGGKLRLDRIVTTPSAFASGGFQDAQREFALQAVLFAIVEQYQGQIRWQDSAAAARQTFAEVSASLENGSAASFQDAQTRLSDLQDLIRGSRLAGAPPQPLAWSRTVDRESLMQLLEWAYEDHVTQLTGETNRFSENASDLQRYAQLIAILGTVLMAADMPDASDAEYSSWALAMIQESRNIRRSVETDDPEAARLASARLGQNCSNCHQQYR